MSYLIKQNELLGRQLDDSFKKNEVMQDGIKQKIKGRQLIMHCDIPVPWGYPVFISFNFEINVVCCDCVGSVQIQIKI